jgi:uncharacterized small protein (DUF1192 family)
VILKDASNPSEPIEVARKELPYTFDVKSSKPRIKEPASDQTQQANVGIGTYPGASFNTNMRSAATHSPASFHSHPVFHPSPALLVQDIQPPLFAHLPFPVFEVPNTLTRMEALIRVRVAEREARINALETSIKRMKATFEADGEKKDAALQPLIALLSNQIVGIQKEIADRLNAFAAERQKVQAAVSAQVADLETQIHILKQENSHDASVLV